MRWQSFCHALSPPFSWLPLLFFHLKTRALFRPFHRFHLSVVVQVGAEVAMSRHFCFRIVHQQSADQYAERVALPFRACVFGIPIVVQSAFVGDSDRVGIVAAGVGAGAAPRQTCRPSSRPRRMPPQVRCGCFPPRSSGSGGCRKR